jgi:hypothetical protein
MVQVTMQLPDQLAFRIMPARQWMPAILELSLAGLRTPASETAAEIIEFLLSSPTADQIMAYHVSDRAQARLQRLLALNEAGLLSEAEAQELDEMERVEHVMILLKAQAAQTQANGDF